MTDFLYKGFMTAKNGTVIPVLADGRTVDSRYNPEKEALSCVNSVSAASGHSFFIVLGIGSALSVRLLAQKFPESRIIALERTRHDIDFLMRLDAVRELGASGRIFLTDIQGLAGTIIRTYLPAKYETPQIIEQRAWMQANADKTELIRDEINRAFRAVSADYSVQAHFGKIWMHNIMGNLKILAGQTQADEAARKIARIDRKKTALIIAAGPSLEKTLRQVQNRREDFFVISTDTGLKILEKTDLTPDAVISIDAQSISTNHFAGRALGNALYFFDICASSSAASHITGGGGKIVYFTSGHPMGFFASQFAKNGLPCLFSGAGTVTIAAVDLARQLGFERIRVIGADFAYSGGKAYARGTYLETLYDMRSTRLEPSEKKYDALMFRTELFLQDSGKNPGRLTTQILDAYRKSFVGYTLENQMKCDYDGDAYNLSAGKSGGVFDVCAGFDFAAFCAECRKSSKNALEIPLLPYIAYLKNRAGQSAGYEDFLNLAHSHIVSYNEDYEE